MPSRSTPNGFRWRRRDNGNLCSGRGVNTSEPAGQSREDAVRVANPFGPEEEDEELDGEEEDQEDDTEEAEEEEPTETR